MPGPFIDTHCHLDDTRGRDLGEVLEEARVAGVTTMITIGCDEATSRRAIEIAAAHQGVFATAGVHPHEAAAGLDFLPAMLDCGDVVAVGECGLDYYYDHSPRDVQRHVFAQQIALANERDLPLVVHTRDAWAETLAILDGEGCPRRTIFHCFTGGPDEARQCLDRGALLSFSGIVTFRNATDVQAAATLCPPDRLLAETDSPYLAPIPHRGRANQPAFVTHVVEALAVLRGEPLDEVAATIRATALAAFPKVTRPA